MRLREIISIGKEIGNNWYFVKMKNRPIVSYFLPSFISTTRDPHTMFIHLLFKNK
jgi:hypothetical protein